jgi:hypothetical protein
MSGVEITSLPNFEIHLTPKKTHNMHPTISVQLIAVVVICVGDAVGITALGCCCYSDDGKI